MVVEIAAKIENNFLFERIVENDPGSIGQALNEKCPDRQQCERRNQLRFPASNCFIDDALRHRRKYDHHQGRQNRESDCSARHPRISSKVLKNS
jgi:hypothetical protein